MRPIRGAIHHVVICCASMVLLTPALAGVEDNAILALEPQQDMIVVKTAAGELVVLSVGDTFPDSEVVVRQVLDDKVIAEEVVIEAERKTIRQVWVYRAQNAAAGSRVQRLLPSLPQDRVIAPVGINSSDLRPDTREKGE